MKAYEYRHVVGFEETNLVGNVYYVNHLRWQGRLRELFLREHVPEILHELERGLALVTVRCACEYLGELAPFDEVLICMRLSAMTQSRISMAFDYWRVADGRRELIARGEQQVACMRRQGMSLVSAPVPASLRDALLAYAAPDHHDRALAPVPPRAAGQ
jgi:enediyne biosynthesis thioesterase